MNTIIKRSLLLCLVLLVFCQMSACGVNNNDNNDLIAETEVNDNEIGYQLIQIFS